MKKYITLALLILFLSGCSIDWSDDKEKLIKEKQNEINILKDKLDKLNKSIELSSNKDEKQCLGYFNSIKKDISESIKIYGDYTTLVEVFYSKQYKKCIIEIDKDLPIFGRYSQLYFYGQDLANSKPFIGISLGCNKKNCNNDDYKKIVENLSFFENIVKELKGIDLDVSLEEINKIKSIIKKRMY